ncbi:MAG: nucleotide sugar dehydrogenase [Deltaproteobacteria bacterium]|nr:nucleotide sugar dehydrogenase [Deltaproteobacteria bacterium]
MAFEAGIVGGCGHAGLPLALVLANAGVPVLAYDTDAVAVRKVAGGAMPFLEAGGDEALAAAMASGNLTVSCSPEKLSSCRFVILVVNGESPESVLSVIRDLAPHLGEGQVLVLRSTVAPGTTGKAARLLSDLGLCLPVACCPERIAQGRGLLEIPTLPQIVSATDDSALAAVSGLFARTGAEIIPLPVEEAEFAKLLTNAWRYVEFACANQFHALAEARGLDFSRILAACKKDYPRLSHVPGPGFSAGPCLEKDTRMLAAWAGGAFSLGEAALAANRAMPAFLVEQAGKRADLSVSTAGILGLAFKAQSDDTRCSLALTLREILLPLCKEVLCADPYVDEPGLVSAGELLAVADVVFVAAPHRAFSGLAPRPGAVVLDPWGVLAPPTGAP